MRRKTYLITSFLILTWLFVMPILGLQSSSQSISSYGRISYLAFLGKGVNYETLWHMYSSEYTTDEVLRRDFSRFRADGIDVISLPLCWFRLEGHVRGSYDGEEPFRGGTDPGGPYGDRVLDGVKHIINIATEHGLNVMIDFHTLFGQNGWCTPNYVIDPVTGRNDEVAILRSEDMKQAYLDMVSHTVQYLADIPGIYTWAILNEPWWYPDVLEPPYEDVDQRENAIDLIMRATNIVKAYYGGSVTVKFVSDSPYLSPEGVWTTANLFARNFGYDQRLFDILGFISFDNFPRVTNSTKLPIYNDAINILVANVDVCRRRGKEVWLTEFGLNSDDDIIQAEGIKDYLTAIRGIPFTGFLAWNWRGDSPKDPIGKTFNLCKNEEGEPRAAYLTFVEFNPAPSADNDER